MIYYLDYIIVDVALRNSWFWFSVTDDATNDNNVPTLIEDSDDDIKPEVLVDVYGPALPPCTPSLSSVLPLSSGKIHIYTLFYVLY